MNKAMKKYPPRPTLTPEAKSESIEVWSDCLDRVSNLWANKEEVIEAVIECAELNDDGYELGKKIDDWGIEVSFDLCEALDRVSSCLHGTEDEMVRDWVKTYNVEPPFPVGARVFWMDGFKKKTGTIVESESARKEGKFAVSEDGETRGWKRILKYEDVELLEESGDE